MRHPQRGYFNALIISRSSRSPQGRAVPRRGCAQILARNVLIYGVGGVIAPFIGIKMIDLALVGLHLA